jgi:hypothetical protein
MASGVQTSCMDSSRVTSNAFLFIATANEAQDSTCEKDSSSLPQQSQILEVPVNFLDPLGCDTVVGEKKGKAMVMFYLLFIDNSKD